MQMFIGAATDFALECFSACFSRYSSKGGRCYSPAKDIIYGSVFIRTHKNIPRLMFLMQSSNLPNTKYFLLCAARNPPIDAIIESGAVPLLVNILRRSDMPQVQVSLIFFNFFINMLMDNISISTGLEENFILLTSLDII